MDYAKPFCVFFSALAIIISTSTRVSSKNLSSNQTTYMYELMKNLWRCQQKTTDNHGGSDYCPMFFDGWTCWPSVTVGTEMTHVCPSMNYISISFSAETEDYQQPLTSSITRRCTEGGTWKVLGNATWQSNYTTCTPANFQIADLKRLTEIVNMVEALPPPHDEKEQIGIQRAFDECIRNVLLNPFPSPDGLYCKSTFDGWGCWNDTLAGETVHIPCPNFVTGFVATKLAHKVCNTDGTWYRHPVTNKTWSNYTTCVDKEDLAFRQYINTIYIAGYSLSAVALFISLVIFYYFKSLKCTRITIHKNLFVSFVINNIMWIVWYTEILPKPDVMYANEVSCQVLHVMVQYFLVTNYFWMFCEGLYLHTVLVVAFVSEETIVKGFYVLGWGVPVIIITLYAALRGTSSKDTEHCWMEESVYNFILSGPVCLSLIVNLLFLVNIVRVLVTKLRAVNSPDANQTRKAARATLILIPLLGLHYLLTPFRPETGSPGEVVYETTAALATSLQGLCVAFLFCFFNGEVIAVLRRKWNLARITRATGKPTLYAMTTSVSSLGRSPSEGEGKLCQQDTQVKWDNEKSRKKEKDGP